MHVDFRKIPQQPKKAIIVMETETGNKNNQINEQIGLVSNNQDLKFSLYACKYTHRIIYN